MNKGEQNKVLSKYAHHVGAEMTDYSDRTPDHYVYKRRDGVWAEWNPIEDELQAYKLKQKCGVWLYKEVE